MSLQYFWHFFTLAICIFLTYFFGQPCPCMSHFDIFFTLLQMLWIWFSAPRTSGQQTGCHPSLERLQQFFCSPPEPNMIRVASVHTFVLYHKLWDIALHTTSVKPVQHDGEHVRNHGTFKVTVNLKMYTILDVRIPKCFLVLSLLHSLYFFGNFAPFHYTILTADGYHQTTKQEPPL